MTATPGDFSIEARALDDPDVVRLTAEVQAWYVVLYGRPDAAEIVPEEFTPPGGLFLVGILNGTTVATGAWRWLNGTDAEIKRMYVASGARRRGLARLVLAELERTAAAAGVSRLVLSTGSPQHEAIALYETSGYVPAEPFGHYAGYSGAFFFAKSLAP